MTVTTTRWEHVLTPEKLANWHNDHEDIPMMKEIVAANPEYVFALCNVNNGQHAGYEIRQGDRVVGEIWENTTYSYCAIWLGPFGRRYGLLHNRYPQKHPLQRSFAAVLDADRNWQKKEGYKVGDRVWHCLDDRNFYLYLAHAVDDNGVVREVVNENASWTGSKPQRVTYNDEKRHYQNVR